MEQQTKRIEANKRYNEALRNAEINAVQKSCSDLERFRVQAERQIESLSQLVQSVVVANEVLEERINKAAQVILNLKKEFTK